MVPSGTGAGGLAADAGKILGGIVRKLAPASRGAEVIGVAGMLMPMRGRVRVDHHPADRIAHAIPGFSRTVTVRVARAERRSLVRS